MYRAQDDAVQSWEGRALDLMCVYAYIYIYAFGWECIQRFDIHSEYNCPRGISFKFRL